MIRKILLAVDGREGWMEGELLAEELGEKLSAEVVVLHVREWLFGPGGPFDEGPVRSFEVLERVTRPLRDRGITVRPKLRSGFPTRTAQQIVEVATSENADLIVVGPHRVHGLIGSMSGDVTDRVVHLSRVPVLVAGSSTYWPVRGEQPVPTQAGIEQHDRHRSPAPRSAWPS